MSLIETKGEFHVALDGQGLILQGSPERPSYRSSNAPVYGTRFASGDRDYDDLSQWWYLIQTDWSGGIKSNISFEDDAKFYYSSNIDAYSRPGSLQLEKLVREGFDNTSNAQIFLDVRTLLFDDSAETLFIDGDNVRLLSDGTLVASGGSSDIFDYIGFKNYLWLFYDGTSGVRNFDGTTETNQTSYINTVISGSVKFACTGVVIGDSLYVFVITNTGFVSCVKTSTDNPASGADWSLVFEIELTIDTFITGAEEIGGNIIFMAADALGSDIAQLYSLNISTGIAVIVREFNSNYSLNDGTGARHITKFLDRLLITVPTGTSRDKGKIYEYDGSSLKEIYSTDEEKHSLGEEATTDISAGCTVMEGKAYWGNLIYDGVDFFNFVKNITDTATSFERPIGYSSENHTLYLKSDGIAQVVHEYDSEETSFKQGSNNSAFLVFSSHDKLQSIDKLLNTVTIGFKELLSGQSIDIYYSLRSTPDPDITTGEWVLLGSTNFTDDGGDVVSKSLRFPEAVTGKKIWFRAELSSGGTDTPVLDDFTLEYLPIPDYKMQWNLNVNCADEVRSLNGSLPEITARELRSKLLVSWQTKSALDFQDMDYASATLSDNPLSSSATTINVDSNVDFPEQGRAKIDDEEIYYTGKTPTTFTGVTRGARGTLAVSHLQNTQVHNGYRVLVLALDSALPVVSEDKNLEYVVGLTLREV